MYPHGVDVFPEQNPIDSGTILQTIQRIDYLVLIRIVRLYKITTCYCKVCAHERSLEDLQFKISFLKDDKISPKFCI